MAISKVPNTERRIDNLQDALAIIANGNTHAAIGAGQYVYVRGHATLAEGMYKAPSAISENAALSSGNLTAVTGGGLNALNSESIVPMAENIIPANADFNDYSTAGVYRVASDAIGQTIQNIPYYASGKLIVIARTTHIPCRYGYHPQARKGCLSETTMPEASAIGKNWLIMRPEHGCRTCMIWIQRFWKVLHRPTTKSAEYALHRIELLYPLTLHCKPCSK